MDLSVVIVNWNTAELLRDCLKSVFGMIEGIAFEVIVVDNASSDGSVAMLKVEFPQVRRVENYENRGFAAANNQAFRIMTGRYALLLNSDTVLTEGAVHELYAFMEEHPEAVMACGQLLNADGSKQNSIAAFPTLLSLLRECAAARNSVSGAIPQQASGLPASHRGGLGYRGVSDRTEKRNRRRGGP